jgi:hypothetical protein
MTKRASILLFAACLAGPAKACTDWKAVAAFDAIIAANDRSNVAYEMTLKNDPMCAPFWKLDRVISDKPSFAEGMCTGAAAQAGAHAADVESDRYSALHDTCEEGRK